MPKRTKRATRFNPAVFRHLREVLGLSNRAFGRRLGYSGTQVSQVEAGRLPSLKYVYRVVDTFRLDIRKVWT